MLRLAAACLLCLALLCLPAICEGHHHAGVGAAAVYRPGMNFQVFAAPVQSYSYNNAALAAQLQAQYAAQQQAQAQAQYQANLQARMLAPQAAYSASVSYALFRPQRLLVPSQPYAAIGAGICQPAVGANFSAYYGR